MSCEVILPNLVSNNYMVSIPRRDILTKVQSFLPPEMKSQFIELGYDFDIANHQGDRIRYGEASLTVITDYNLKNYQQFVEWYEDSIRLAYQGVEQTHETLIVYIMDPVTFKPVATISLIGTFPTSISGNAFDITSTEINQFSVILRTTSMKIDIL